MHISILHLMFPKTAHVSAAMRGTWHKQCTTTVHVCARPRTTTHVSAQHHSEHGKQREHTIEQRARISDERLLAIHRKNRHEQLRS